LAQAWIEFDRQYHAAVDDGGKEEAHHAQRRHLRRHTV
jgi:hypothetical protein